MSIRLNGAAGLLAALGAGLLPSAATAQTKLLRFPDIAGDRVAFCYAGDVWTAPAKGGNATRLTAHPGLELFPKYSPDGKWLAFTGQYEGDEQVYVMPAEGGQPKQLTYYPARGPFPPRGGYDNQVMGWTPDGASILFRSQRDADGIRSEGQLFTVPAKGGLAKPLPMPTSGAGDFSPDGKRIAYSPLFRDFRTWKRYEGGWAQDLYVYDLATNDAKPFATSKRTERDPMWIGDSIYFASDRDGTLNLFSWDPKTDAVAKLTASDTWDVRWPSSDNASRIVYELNGELRVYDVRAKADQAIPIFVPNDGVAVRPSRVSVEKNVEGFELSPKGERALFVARGDVFTLPIEKGPTRNLTATSGVHDKHARWSPDGKRIAFVSDASGEDEIWLVDQAGGKPEPLTKGRQGMTYAPEWSAEGTHIAFSHKDGGLFVVTLADRKVVEVARDERGTIRDYAWSPKGAYLAFSKGDPDESRSIHVWSATDGALHRVTDELFNEESPAWDLDGEHLFYLSDRDFAPQISTFEWNFATNRTTGIYAVTLKKDGKSPFPPQSDEVTFEEKKAEGEAKPEEKKPAADDGKDDDAKAEAKDKPAKKETPFRIDFEGLGSRVTRVPIEGDNIDGLAVGKGHLLYTVTGAPFYGRDSYVKPALKLYSFKDRKESTLAENATGWALSRDGAKVLVRQEDKFNLYDVKPDAKDKKAVSTKGLVVDRVPAEEWRQFFDEAWRRYRDFFYAPNMHGYDWKAIGDRYRALLPHVAHRADLNYLLGEMVAELNVGHTYIQGGDYEIPPAPEGRAPRGALRARPGVRPLPHRAHPPGPQPGGPLPGPAHRGGRRRPGGRLRPRDRRCRAARRRRPLPPPPPQDRPGDPDPQREAGSRGRPQDDLPAHHERGAAPLPRVDERQPREGGQAHERPRRLPARPGHGRPRHLRVRQVVLPPDPQAGAGGGRAVERRGQRLAVDHRAAGHEAARHALWPAGARGDVPGDGLPRPQGRDPQRDVGVRRRHLPAHVPQGRARPAGRQAQLGRRRRDRRPGAR